MPKRRTENLANDSWLTNACEVHLPPFSILLFPPHIYARIQSNRCRRTSERARFCACHVHDIFLFPSVPTTLRFSNKKYRMDGTEGKGRVGRTDGRTRTPRRGGSIWRHWGKAARHSCSIHAMKAETYPLPRPCILQNSIFDHTRFRIRNYKNHQMRRNNLLCPSLQQMVRQRGGEGELCLMVPVHPRRILDVTVTRIDCLRRAG